MQIAFKQRNLFILTLALLSLVGTSGAQDREYNAMSASHAAQQQADAEEADETTMATRPTLRRARTTQGETSAVETLRAARRIYVIPNQYVDEKYLEYKLAKQPEFTSWGFTITKNERNADLAIEIHRRAFNYVFSIVEPRSGTVVLNGKVMAINGLVAAEELGREIVRRMKEIRALPTTSP
ncbi:MAG: hypothetical protein C4334_11080 [Pyrinomonas sp.]|uniref:hypothetical protein n=1 Tax=Pyrinomonas sp. TaxID=2080306 RepID=UPI003322EF6D